MVRVLLDTCVLSELHRSQGHAGVRACVAGYEPEHLFVSVITVGELTKGIQLLDDVQRKRGLMSWLMELEQRFDDQILPIDRDTAHVWGEITARTKRLGAQVPMGDALIAATALRHGLHVMTRNVKDFVPTGVLIINPWDEAG